MEEETRGEERLNESFPQESLWKNLIYDKTVRKVFIVGFVFSLLGISRALGFPLPEWFYDTLEVLVVGLGNLYNQVFIL